MQPFREDIRQAVRILGGGGVILYPTDTVWGIGCDATDAQAVARVYEIKRRKARQNLLVLVADMNMLRSYVRQIPDTALQLLEYADRPMSIIYPEAVHLPDNLTADDGSVGIRLPDDLFCRELIGSFGKPIVSTSANISETPAPRLFKHISEEVKEKVDYIVRWRQDDRQPSAASSVIKVEKDNSFRIIRM
ncbi:MAG: threonylcarbamoyl-AMP synthase [Bacteroidales bacterium]|nr:threonylcarbamoyl-AMP synthase [Bacteroidales bacterium]